MSEPLSRPERGLKDTHNPIMPPPAFDRGMQYMGMIRMGQPYTKSTYEGLLINLRTISSSAPSWVVLFNIRINNLDRIKGIHIQFAKDTKLGGVADRVDSGRMHPGSGFQSILMAYLLTDAIPAFLIFYWF